MTNRLAVILFSLICVSLFMDWLFFGPEHLTFLAQKFYELMEWVAFWR